MIHFFLQIQTLLGIINRYFKAIYVYCIYSRYAEILMYV